MIDRRSFLKATIAAATGVVSACSDDPTDPTDVGTDVPDGDALPDADIGTDAAADADATGDPGLLDGAAIFALGVASGDPRSDGMILWTRCVAPDADESARELRLEVALDDAFEQRVLLEGEESLPLTAEADHDFCVKVRLTGLEAGTEYYYRFVTAADDGEYGSTVGRAKTAPLADADVEARFAFVSCQDFNGRYYTSYKRLMDEDLDFFVHLGDYVYETTGDPSFQDTTPGRVVEFTDEAGAIALEEDGETFWAARSLDNYRQLYRTHRGDPDLQRVHAAMPMIAIWDDHEFADDCHGATSTMHGGREDELDLERRANANRAWFDYMPVDYLDQGFEYDNTVEPPNDIRIYRDIRYGQNLHLVMTDLRLYRADHVVPEDAFPGRVAMTQDDLAGFAGELPDWADPYVDVGAFEDGAYVDLLLLDAERRGYSVDHATGLIAVRTINNIVAGLIEEGDERWAPIEVTDEMERGLAFITMGKSSPFSSIASRYLAVTAPFETYAAWRFEQTDGASEHMLGDEQEEWFRATMQTSDAVWKVWGNEFTLTRRTVDATAFAVPPEFQQIFSLSVEDWDGCPNKRDELLDSLADVDNVVAITGDIHAFFAGAPRMSSDRTRGVVEFVTAGISSEPYERLLLRTATADPTLLEAGAPALALLVEDMLVEPGVNPSLAYAAIKGNGFATATVSADRFDVSFFQTARENVRNPLTDEEAREAFSEQRFRVDAGDATLQMERDGEFVRWNPEDGTWD